MRHSALNKPRWVPGDFVMGSRHPINMMNGVIISVTESNNHNYDHLISYPYVYYVFWSGGGIGGPFFTGELQDA